LLPSAILRGARRQLRIGISRSPQSEENKISTGAELPLAIGYYGAAG
jgi:hypothetical protein